MAVVKLKEDMITRDGPIQLLDMEGYFEGIWMAGNPLGPFEFKGEIIDNHSLNIHGSITEFRNQAYLFYHVAEPSNWERRVCIALLSYNNDGTIQPVETTLFTEEKKK